jgi:uncharacterized surface protein with fasciclin (FAS1) repeats
MRNLTKTLGLAVAAVAVAGFGFTTASSFADHHMQGGYGDSAEKQEKKDIIATAKAAGQFNTLATALTEAELVETLQGEGPFTVFAPTDEAFKKLPSGTVESLLQEENREQLRGILLYHVVSGKVASDKVVEMDEAETVQGSAISIKVEDGKVMLNDNAQVVKPDVEASNGLIHVIDGVLLPSSN